MAHSKESVCNAGAIADMVSIPESRRSAGEEMATHSSILFFFFSFIFISWRLITLQYCSGFCHTLTWISHGFTCIPHPDPPSYLPLHPLPLGLPSAPGLSTCLMHPTWAGDLFHPRYYTCFDAVLSKHPTLSFSHIKYSCLENSTDIPISGGIQSIDLLRVGHDWARTHTHDSYQLLWKKNSKWTVSTIFR